ncbi:unnamed protein product [Microthlaspi erraticum]|uniref:Uncharacterized protein n=1 Tax=Microthlaspi erraticum TaxID=1685480 RepID=A0A6D2IT40_9BRAS|nr:unnamed protein product [Microthlaspi erraticum]
MPRSDPTLCCRSWHSRSDYFCIEMASKAIFQNSPDGLRKAHETMKPESKKISEKRRIQIKDDGDSSFDLSLLKEAIDNASNKTLLV